ncbi:phosphoribosylanthranilate isomerase [Aneurinibacillus soli]|uniref:N-(5'-phosphoribosyl)anthranilate isomerase n=1 Tax=Aneurinibacillus soli TaxID=1500254 RepID=A0A0U5BF40_9BACL|nr:phosphoribosylanthranilate isomerase [Aneurinibacillus soli]PYE63054.1 phosphoribosylanthranilate isomerase [Aneurinibacillus soli]BAU28887.1 N-(5'-phosphoribosyl)anthranilate isomerase [Aneurinibacillus soli]
MKAKLKICGITEEDTLQQMAAERLVPDQIGFVFAPSRRRIEPEQWGALASHIPAGAKAAGVFVNPSLEEIDAVFREQPLAIVQLHGMESAAFCKAVKDKFHCRITKAVGLSMEGKDDIAELAPYSEIIDMLLLDTAIPGQSGGTGRTFDWERIAPYRSWCHEHGVELFVAGGIHAGNAVELLAGHKPDGIDLSSGVETDGRKDLNKIRTLIERMNAYEHRDSL